MEHQAYGCEGCIKIDTCIYRRQMVDLINTMEKAAHGAWPTVNIEALTCPFQARDIKKAHNQKLT